MFSVNKKPFERVPLKIAVLLFVFGCLLAGLAAWKQSADNQLELQKLLKIEASGLTGSIIAYIESYEQALLGMRGLVVAHGDDSISRSVFKTYAISRNLSSEFPGTRGFGFIRRVTHENEAEFVKQTRQDDMPDFTVKELSPHDGDRYIIQYIEPGNRNLRVFGFDIASEKNQRVAAQQAMLTGSPTITAPISLVQSSGLPLRSFLMLLPVYHLTMPLDSAEQREAATFGWTFVSIVIDEVLQHAGIDNKQIALQITDVSPNEPQSIFYTSTTFADEPVVLNTVTIKRAVLGRTWQFELRALPLFYQYHERLSPLWIASFIIFCALLLSVLLYAYVSYRQRSLHDSIEHGRLAAIVESSNDAILSIDLNGIITSWNRAADRLFDFSAVDAIGKSVASLIVPEELVHEDEEFLRNIRRGEFVPRYTTVRKKRSGQRIDVSVTVSPIRDKHGNIVSAAKTIVDITEQKRSQELFQLTIEAVPDAIITVNNDNLITLVNQKAMSLLGYDKSELLGQNISLVIPLRYRERHWQHTQHFHANPMVRPMGAVGQSLFVLCKDGHEVPVEIQLCPIQTANEKFTLTSIVDIRLRKELQAEVQTTMARMKMAINALNVGIWVLRLDDRELIWDERMFELYGLSESLHEISLNHELWYSRIHPDDREEVKHKVLGHIAGTGSFDTEFRIVLDNGDIRHIRAASLLELDETGTPVQMVGVNLDITAIKTAETQIRELNEKRTAELQALNASLEQQVAVRTEELRLAVDIAKQANAAKSEFLANMSHEIRSPMNAILGLAYLLQKHDLGSAERDMVSKIDKAGRSLLVIINECLDFSKIEANLLTIEQMPFRLSHVLDNVASIMSNSLAEKPVELCIAPLPTGVDYLRGDSVRLEQILINLAGNAIKFTETGEVVVEVQTVSVLANQVRLRFSIRDTGIGISPEQQESIFDPFIQANNSTTRLYGGTGLGLSISRRLVELMGGTLQLKSQPGVGSEFFFELTLTISDTSNDLISIFSHQRVLIVDDNAIARQLLEATVISLGWDAYTVDSGEKALQTLVQKGTNYFDLLLLDWRMPKLDGIQVVSLIQEQFGEHCPIVLMATAYDRSILLKQSGSELVDDIICKPVTGSLLFNAVLEVKNRRGELLSYNDKQRVDGEQLMGLNLLVVDDSEINRDVARQILVGEGAKVEVAEHGQAAIDLLVSMPNHFHLVLMDVQMPVMDGYTATRQIRALPELEHLPIIALTAGAFKNQHLAALEAGMDDFIAKPFDVDELIACVVRLTRHKPDEKEIPRAVLPTQAIAFDTMLLIDVEHGLKKWRSVEIYQQHLRLFLQQHAQDAEQINNELSNGNKTVAMTTAHKLLGVTGALSLKRLARLVEEMGDAEELSIHLAPMLSETFDAIKTYLNSETPQETGQTTVENTSISVMAELKQLITKLDSDDPRLIEPQLSILSGKLPQELFDKILIAVENFDFRGAEAIANVLLIELLGNSENPGE
jgi:PAS domain S-box-containing protein